MVFDYKSLGRIVKNYDKKYKGEKIMSNIKFEIKETLGVLSEGIKGWQKEINIISWSDRKPKIDIRDWDETHEKMGKGVALDKEEFKRLKEILNNTDIDELEL